ncbi:phosphate ABC transporter substrate-binding protein PstS [Coralloluteibacterium thermophilus]|uniref:Phosphate-binding protein PstS n=1 Tax=Coralloluteibacterium thermophilum TaxID=2707049 RepID=A0ABV9NMF6_9GAMM
MPASASHAPLRHALIALVAAVAVTACSGNDGAPTPGTAPGGAPAADAATGDRVTAQITGAGASFVFPVMSRWSSDYAAATGSRVNYQSIGSGGGIAQIKAGTVDFGSSDAPLPPDELEAAGLAQFPSVIGGVVPVVNLDGITPGQLRLTGAVLADIFLGRITDWGDARIAEINPGVQIPAGRITVVHRSDGSGTTFNFANYLSKVSPDWQSSVGEGTSVRWPTGIGGKGNEGVAAYVQQVRGSIGYVELSYALQNQMSHTALQNRAGNFVEPNSESFQAAAASADWANAQDFHLVMTDAPGEQSWPIAATNFILVHKQPRDAARGRAVLDFFTWVYANGDAQAEALDYVPLPDELVQQIEAYWAETVSR